MSVARRHAPSMSRYETSHDYTSIDDTINRVEYFSNAVMEDSYDAAARSRARDNDMLRNANATIEMSRMHPHMQAMPMNPLEYHRMEPMYSGRLHPKLAQMNFESDMMKEMQQEGVYYRPAFNTAGMQASQPPLNAAQNYQMESPENVNLQKTDQELEDNRWARTLSIEEAKKQSGSRYPYKTVAYGIPFHYACGGDPIEPPVTDLRRRLRRQIARAKGNPKYYTCHKGE